MVAAVAPTDSENLSELQEFVPELSAVFQYLETGVLPEDKRTAKKLAMNESQYLIQDGVLYHVEVDGTLRVIPPTKYHEKLFQEAHGGHFGAHLQGRI